MGIDFVALIPHRLDLAGLRAKLTRLDAINPDIVRWWPPAHSGIPGRPWTFNPGLDEPWHLEPDADTRWARGAGVFVNGSRLCSFLFYRHALTFPGTGDRWRRFVDDAVHRLFIRRVCRVIARVFDADRALYAPDGYLPASRAVEMISSNATLAEAEQWLAEHCGPPAGSADHIVFNEGDDGSYTYHVDHFRDLE